MTYPAETPFRPGASQNITAGAASAATALGAFPVAGVRTVRIVTGAEAVRVAFGASTVTATATSLLVPAASVAIFSVAPGETHIAMLRNAAADSICNVTNGAGN
ncbi:hypothetical protein PHLH3_08630 [Pseudomonas sp. St386]|uniref:hypothetical protein n=1 Tax=Pseudomonas sp. St386 TaxID=2678256 RepID=UPI001BB43D98|nr:hypothetical protein [Pseudomonas sp. St386]BBP51237.1 hypothetical protein PHLH3_08630 [Pseudomonas sp. St386]